jgi:hypothetical protein
LIGHLVLPCTRASLEHTFGGRPRHKTNGNTFIFDLEELERVGRAYNISTKIQTKIIVTEESQGISYEGMKAMKAIQEAPPYKNEGENEENKRDLRGNPSTNNEEKEGMPSVENQPTTTTITKNNSKKK